MKVKRFTIVFSVVIILLMTVSAITGCDNGTPTPTPADSLNSGSETQASSEVPTETSITFGGTEILIKTVWPTTWGFDELGKNEIEDMRINWRLEFEEKHDCTVVVEQLTGNTAETELIPRLLAGDVFDIIQAQRMDLEKLRLAGDFLYDLSSLSSIDLDDDMWDQGLIRSSTFGGQTYGVYGELNYVQNGYFVNLSLLERLGLEDIYDLIENKQWTLEKFREFAVAAAKDTNSDGEIDQFGASLQDLVLGGFMHSNGVRIMSQETDGTMKYTYNSPKTIEMLGFLRNLVQVDKVAPDRSFSNQTLEKMFMEGKLLFFGYPSWIASNLNEMEDDYAYIPLPIGADIQDYSYASDAWHPVLMIPKTNPEPEKAAFAITEYFKMEDVAVDMVDNVTHMVYFRGNDRAMDAFKMVRQRASFDYGLVEAGFTQPWLAMVNSVWGAGGDPVALLEEIDSQMNNYVDDVYNN